jgi:hypothetical protein
MENNQQSFWQFSDQLRLQNSNLANLSLNDSIWSTTNNPSPYPASVNERKNFEIRVGGGSDLNLNLNNPIPVKSARGFNDGWNSFKPTKGESDLNNFNGFNDYLSNFKQSAGHLERRVDNGMNNFNNEGSWNSFKSKGSDLNLNLNLPNDYGWKIGSAQVNNPIVSFNNGGFNKGVYSKPQNNLNLKKGKGEDDHLVKGIHKKNKKPINGNDNKDKNKESGGNKNDKRFKTLPPSESLPRNETVGGYIFVCNSDTMAENLKRQLFGLPPRYRDSVRQITPGLPLFLYNYSTHQLHGVFEAASFGESNIDPTAWEDKKYNGESRFPAQVRVITRKVCEPLEEDSFRPILHHYDGPKFRLELNIPEALSLLDIFQEEINE